MQTKELNKQTYKKKKLLIFKQIKHFIKKYI